MSQRAPQKKSAINRGIIKKTTNTEKKKSLICTFNNNGEQSRDRIMLRFTH